MKVQFKTSVFFFILVISLSCACKKKRCNSTEVGSVELKEVSKSFLPYANGETLIFENSVGEQLVFVNQLVEEPYEICTKLICKNITGPYETTPCEYYSTTGLRNVLSNESDSLFIDMAIGVNSYHPQSLLFYDFFMVNMSKIGHLARGEFVSAVHFDTPDFEIERTEVREPFIEAENLTLDGISYDNILYTTESNNMVYYKMGTGIIFLKIDDVLFKYVE